MARLYTVSVSGTYTAAGGDIDLLSLQPADDKPVQLAGWSIGQSTEVGDAAEEGVRISVIWMPATFTVGSGGSAPTPRNVDDPANGQAAGFTARVLDTTVATTSGTAQTLEERGWNERSTPYDWIYPDVAWYPKARQTEALVVRGQTTLADDMTVNMTFWVFEN